MRNLQLTVCLVALFLAVQSAYTPKLGLDMAYMSSIAYESTASINAWSCGRCGKYPLTNVKAFSIQTGDLQGFTGYSASLNAIVLSFRGSSNIQNWIINLSTNMVSYPKCSNCKVHNGFYTAWNQAKSTVNSQIQSLLSLHRGVPIYVTGHSLGGALATLSVPDIKETFGNVASLLTFGQPRVGNKEFATYFGSVIDAHRVVHYADIVPHIPPMSFGFTHQGNQIWYDKEMKTYKTCSAESNTCSNSLPATSLNSGDHSMDTYITLPGTFFDRFIKELESVVQMIQLKMAAKTHLSAVEIQ